MNISSLYRFFKVVIFAGCAVLLLTPLSVHAAAAFVQQASSADLSSTKSYSISFSSTTTAGDLILVGFDKDGTQTPTITDSQGNTFTEIGSELTSPGANHTRLYYAKNIKGGTDSVTITLSTSTSYLEAYISEYGGIDLTNPIDAQAANTGTNASVSSGNATTTTAGDIIYALCMADWSATVGTGFTMRANLDDNLVEDKTSGSAGSYSATATANNGWAIQMAALRPASAVDTTPPSVPTNLMATTVTQTNVTFMWTASTDNVGVTGYKIYRGGTQIGTSTVTSYTDTGLTASTAYSYTVSAYDAAGNNSAQSTALAVTTKAPPDTTPPVISITTPANNATVSGTVTVSGTASDNVAVASVAVSVDGGTLVPASGTTSWTFSTNSLSLANGTHTVAAVATDTSGNKATNTISVTVNNDTTPPSVPTNLTATTVTQTNATFMWTASTDNVGVTGYKIYRGGTQIGTSTVTSYTDSGLSASTTYSYTVSAYDAAGNNSAQSTALQVTTQNPPDTTPPVISITTPANNATVSGTVTVSGTASDNVAVASVAVSVDGGTLVPASGTTSWTFSTNSLSLANGTHTVAAVATDTSGNKATNTISVTVNNDTTPPSVPTNLTATTVTQTNVTFTWTASTDNAGVTGYKVYRGGTQIGTSTVTSYTDTGLTASTAYSYTVSAYDAAGNNSAQSTALVVTTKAPPDTTPPVISITTPANNATVSGTVTVSGTASDNVAVASVAVSVDGGTLVPASGTTSWTFSTNSLSLANGTHTIAAVATDTSGNNATNTISVTVNNDTTPPSVPTNLVAMAVSQTSITFSWMASTDNVGVVGYLIYRGGTQIGTSTVTSYTDSGLSASTTYSYTVSAYDAAGNNSSQSVAIQLTTQSVPLPAVSSPAYPLKLAAGQHYVVDQNGYPFFFHGDCPWSLSELLSPADAEYYISNRWVQGYNSIMLDFTTDGLGNGTTDWWGRFPFTNTIAGPHTNLLAWNESYFTNCDAIIRLCGKYGMCAVIYPIADGYQGSGWYSEIAANSTNSLYLLGQYFGNRWKNFTNIVYVGAGDDDEPGTPTTNLWNWIAAGILSQDTNHLITAQAARPTPASYYSGFITLNSTYGSQFPYIESLANYQAFPVLASFAREPYYEHKNITGTPFTALDCRHFAYWAVFSGDAGHFYGDEEEYPLTNGWQNEMWDEGATTMTNVMRLMGSRPWYNCVPDSTHTVVTGGYGTSGTIDYITCTREATGKTIMVYVPQDQMSPAIDLTQVSGTNANVWWYNPRTGAATALGSFATTGTQTFIPPDTNDWVLVLDDASLGWGAPGTTYLDSLPPSQPSALTVASTSVSSVSLSWMASTDNVGVIGYQIFRNGVAVGTSTVTNFTDTGLAAATTYAYTVSAYDVAGNNSPQSSAVQATTANITPPTAPTNLTLTGSTPTSVSFAWSPSTGSLGVAGYQIFRNGLAIATTTNTAFVDANISANTTYTYGVAAYDAAGNTSPQSTWQFSIQWNAP